METEAVLVALDVGTSKVVALIGEKTHDGSLNILGKGAPVSAGLKKGVVINIDQTVSSIRAAIEQAERLSGYHLQSAFVSVGGSHVESQNTKGAVAVSGPRKEVSQEDVIRATEVAQAVSIPSNRQVLHVLHRSFVVDGQEGVDDPIGMSAVRLEVETHIVHAGATAVQNLSKCVQQAAVRIEQLVAGPLAAAEAVVSDNERQLGVAVVDVGAGTTGLALFLDGAPFHTSVLPIGGNNVTNDLAIGLKTSLQVAEDLKIRHGTADLASVQPEELVTVDTLAEGQARTVQRAELASIVEARMRELFEKLGEEIEAAGHGGVLPAGVVLTGGGAQLAGAAELGREVLEMPVRVAAPIGVGGLTDHLLTPAFSTAIGLLRWGARSIDEEDQQGRYGQGPGSGLLARLRDWLRTLFP
ncbi:MAG TPA: cell division protein FtsA [Candidatus Limnocylindrales bacterium]|nr:cell division protein FtsA [Candidatus Limnocylindrales bacterium]